MGARPESSRCSWRFWRRRWLHSAATNRLGYGTPSIRKHCRVCSSAFWPDARHFAACCFTPEGWNLVILADGSWHSAVFSSAKQSVKELRNNAGNPLENYSLQGPDGRKYDDPGSTYIPLSSEEAKEKAAYIYASETMHSFKLTHPVLGWLISADQENSAALILNDVQDYFSANRNMIYPLDQGFKLGVQEIVRELEQGTDRLIKIARGIILAVFALGEAICFGTIGIMAYRSLQINRNLITTK